jgi:antitoxin component HigA of HigAB toxin-antitoxin module
MANEITPRIRTEADYEKALDEIEQYFDREPAPGTPEAEHFNALTDAIAHYEETHWAIAEEPTSPAGATPPHAQARSRRS